MNTITLSLLSMLLDEKVVSINTELRWIALLYVLYVSLVLYMQNYYEMATEVILLLAKRV